MLFHVLSLCVVWSPGHFPGWISPYREAAGDAALQGVEWGIGPYTASYFPCFSLF